MRVLFALVFCVQACLVLGQGCSTFNPCSDDQTCCPGPSSSEVGCCPAPNAVCCSDGQHCCPSGTVCDLSKGTCDNPSKIPFVFKKEQPEIKLQSIAVKKAQKADIVYCPGGLSYCQDGTTCCQLPNGQYGCCPYPSAMCCADRVHCCPYGTRCDTTSQYCLQANSPMAVAPKRPRTPAFPVL